MRTLNTRTKYKIIGSDYSAQEPRLTAHMSKDPEMIKAYQEGKDLYCVIGTGMFNNNYEDNLEFYPAGTEIEIDGQKVICGNKTHVYEEGKARRKAAKTMLLAILYGMGAGTAGARMGKTKEEGQELMDNFFTKFTTVKGLIESSKNFLAENGYVEDWAGRRRHLPDFSLPDYEAKYNDESKNLAAQFNPIFGCADRKVSDPILNSWIAKATQAKGNKEFDDIARQARMAGINLQANTGRKAQAERQCLNARIQGGAASLTKLAMVNIFNDEELNNLKARLIATVHDEILVECPAFYADQVVDRLPQVMIDTAAPFITVPMKCDPYCVDRWYADTAAAELLHEFKLFQEDKKNKTTGEIISKGMTKEEALEKIYKLHPELTKACINHTLETGEDLDFSLV